MKGTTEGDWYVVQDLPGEQAEFNGRMVVVGPPDDMHLIADCRSGTLPESEIRCNAKLVARAQRMAEALILIEEAVGDLPASSEVASKVYAIVARAMTGLDLRPRHDPEEQD